MLAALDTATPAFHQSAAGSTAAQSSSYYVAKGISYAIDAKVGIVNLSLTGPQDRLVTQAVEQALMAAVPGLRATIQLLPLDVEAHFGDDKDPL